MATITHDPGYFQIDNSDLSSRSVNLTFDVLLHHSIPAQNVMKMMASDLAGVVAGIVALT